MEAQSRGSSQAKKKKKFLVEGTAHSKAKVVEFSLGTLRILDEGAVVN